jgi:MerR family transcriptional regulator, copper efflux regulator
MQTLTIGQVALEAGIGVETVRFYEREGLLQKPTRLQSEYRQFDLEVIDRLRFITQAQRLGFTLREVRQLLALKLDPHAKRSDVRERAGAKVADIDKRIAELQRMKRALAPLIAACNARQHSLQFWFSPVLLSTPSLCSSRSPLNTTSSEAPVSAAIAAQSEGQPANVNTTKMALMAREKPMF